MLGGCFESIKVSADGTSPQLIECEKLAQEVALPPIKAGMSKSALIARYRAALVTANQNNKNAAACIAEVLNASEGDQK
jgi:hypothetical protein